MIKFITLIFIAAISVYPQTEAQKKHPKFPILMNHYNAYVNANQKGNLDLALEEANTALNLSKEILGEESSITGSIYENIGNIYVSKKELLKAPVIGSFIKAVGCIPIDRKNPAQAAVALRNLTKSLLNGNKICIFPEGTRTDDGHVADFKPVSLSIPMKYKIPILPVTIDGDYKLMKKNSFYCDLSHNGISKNTLILLYQTKEK